MTARSLSFVELPGRTRTRVPAFPKVKKGDRVEVRVIRRKGGQEIAEVPPEVASVIGALVEKLLQGGRVAIMEEDKEVTPNEAANILGMSRPLVVHRMDVGDIPFRYVGKHRRSKLRDVLVFKEREERRQRAMDRLAEDTEDLIERHGL